MPVVKDAARNARTKRPITSSMTAAPRMTEASGDDIFPASIRVLAEMETLVAVNAPPRKRALFQGRPRACAAPAPRKNGQMTPDKATRNAVMLASRMRSISVSRPAMNIRTKPPTCAIIRKAFVACPPWKRLRCIRSNAPGPAATPTRSSPRIAGIPKRVQSEAASLLAGRSIAISNASWRVADILSYLEPARTGRVSCFLDLRRRRNPAGAESRQASAFDAFAAHGADGGGLAAGQIGLHVIHGEFCRSLCLFSGLVANAQAHKELAELEPGDEAIRRLTGGLAQLLKRFLDLQIDPERHAQQHPNLGNLRFQVDGAAKLRDEACALMRLEHAWIAEHALQQSAGLGADRRRQ